MDILATALLLVLVAICFYTDLMHKKIYNWATLPGIGIGVLINVLFGGIAGLKSSGIGFAIGFGFLFIIFLFGGMGGGDVKLMGAIGAIKGYPFIISALVYSILVGGFIAFAVLIWKKKFLRTMLKIFLFLIHKIFPFFGIPTMDKEHMEKVPFGIAIVLGTIWAIIMHNVLGTPYFDQLWLR